MEHALIQLPYALLAAAIAPLIFIGPGFGLQGRAPCRAVGKI